MYRYDGVSWIEEAKLAGSDLTLEGEDFFAAAVAIDGGVVVVGAPLGPESEAFGAGTAYVFQRFGTTWIEQGKLTRADPQAVDLFGGAVALSGDFALVGAFGDDDACISDPLCNSGSAYVFSLAEFAGGGIPTLSTWGAVVMLLMLLLAAGTIVLRRPRLPLSRGEGS